MSNVQEKRADPARMVGRCEMFDEIACGGMATIHLGRMRGAGGFSRTVAIKRMHPHISRSPDFVAMFLDEARIVARVSHPNVVSTLDLVEDEGDLFIIMEYVEGLSLAALLRAARGLGERAPLNVTARVVAETLRGLHAAHEATDEDGDAMHIVHRDISPENVLVGVDGYPRVLDFGVARASVRLSATRDGQVKGKVAYMAPEQVLGQEVDRRTDVYAASAILWQALTGRRLWKAENLVQLAHRMLNDPIKPPSAVSSDVPKSFDDIVLKGLQRDISKRWRTAADMADALEAVGGFASHRDVGLWVRRLGRQQLTVLAAKVAAVEARDKASRNKNKAKARKVGSTMNAQVKIAELMAEAERDAPRGPPIPEETGQSGIVPASDDLLWGKSDEHKTAATTTGGSRRDSDAERGSAADVSASRRAPAVAHESEPPDPAAAAPKPPPGKPPTAAPKARSDIKPLPAAAKPPAPKAKPAKPADPNAKAVAAPVAPKVEPSTPAKPADPKAKAGSAPAVAQAALAEPPPPAPSTPKPLLRKDASDAAPAAIAQSSAEKPVPAEGKLGLTAGMSAAGEESTHQGTAISEPPLMRTAWPPKKIGIVAGVGGAALLLIILGVSSGSDGESAAPGADAGAAANTAAPTKPAAPPPSLTVEEDPPTASATPSTTVEATPSARPTASEKPPVASAAPTSEPPPVVAPPPVKPPKPPKNIYSQD